MIAGEAKGSRRFWNLRMLTFCSICLLPDGMLCGELPGEQQNVYL
jgi:hypothetical protein